MKINTKTNNVIVNYNLKLFHSYFYTNMYLYDQFLILIQNFVFQIHSNSFILTIEDKLTKLYASSFNKFFCKRQLYGLDNFPISLEYN